MRRLLNWIRAALAQLFSRKLLMPYLVSFAAIVAAAVLLFGLWFSFNVRVKLHESICQNASSQTRRAAAVLESTIADLNSLTIKLNYLGAITPGSFSRNSLEAYRALSYYDYTSFKYDDMAIYYPDNLLLMSVRGTTYASVYFNSVPQSELLISEIAACDKSCVLSTITYGASRTQGQLIFAQPLPLNSRTPRYAVFYSIHYATLRNQLTDGQNASPAVLRALVRADGELIWSNSDLLSANLSALNGSEQTIRLNGINYLYTTADVAGMMTLIALDEVTSQFDEVNRAMRTLVWFCSLLVALATALAVWSVRRSYQPISSIVRAYRREFPDTDAENDTDLSALSSLARHYGALLQEQGDGKLTQEQLQDLFVISTIQGKHVSALELANIHRNLGIDFTSGESFVCILLFDAPPSEAEQTALREALNERGANFHGCMSLLAAEKTVICLISSPTADMNTRTRIAQRLLDECASNATVAVGYARADMSGIGRSYIEARAALDYRLIRGKNTVILFDELPDESTSRREYPSDLLAEYAKSLKTWDMREISARLDEILMYVNERRLGLQLSRCICYELTNAFFREASALNAGAAFDRNALDVFAISEYESVRELTENIRLFSARIREYVGREDATANERFAWQCREIMRANLANSQFSLEQIAEPFGITPQTLRRRFKQITQATLVSTMTEMRVERAKELLAETDLDIGAVLAQVGYQDASSFTRTFRAIVGVSPSHYREIRGRDAKPK